MTTRSTDISRREFLARTGAGVAGAAAVLATSTPAFAYPLDGIMGLQSFDARNFLAKDLPGTLKTLAGWGYKALDLVVPPADQVPTYRKALDEAGMVCHNAHFSANGFEEANWAATLGLARTLGVKEMVCSGGAPSARGGAVVSVDSWKAYADKLNQYGARTKTEGLQLGWHNHGEFAPIAGGGGLNPYDVLMQNTDPAVVKFQIDVGNCAVAGGDPIMYLTKYPTRFYSMHARDVKEGKSGLAVGEGTLDFKTIFTLAKKNGIHNYDVETGAPEDVVMEKLRMSAEYLKNFAPV